MKMTYKNISIESKFLNNKNWNFGGNVDNYNNHTITVVNLETKKRFSFEFWNSNAIGEIKTESDLIGAFVCFLNDCTCAINSLDDCTGALLNSLDEFCSEFGYELKEGRKIYNACVKSLKKYDRVLTEYDIYDFINELNVYIEENY